MEEMTVPDYVKGFNQGYVLAREIPSVSKKMFENLPEKIKQKPRMKGIIDGIGQLRKERFLEKQRSKTPKSPASTKGKQGPVINR